jgi:hypothetical protein
MLDTIQFAAQAVTDLVMVLAIPVLLSVHVRERRKGPECVDWTPADRRVMRICRAVMWSGAALAWAVVLATMIHRPGLIREPALVSILFMPLILAFLAAIWSTPTVSESLHRTRNFRMLMLGATAVAAFALAASLLVLFNAWSGRV